MPRINFYVEVSETELANFLARVSGQDGRAVSHTVEEEDTEAPATDAPATDKNGVAWDARFHASSKALNADGTWRRKRGLSDEEASAAEAYEKGGGVALDAANIGEVTAGAVTQTSDLAALPVETVVEVPVENVAAPALPVAAPALPTMPGLPAAPTAPAPVSYEEVVALYTAAIGKNPSIDIAAMYKEAGVTDPNVLNTPEGAELRIKLAALLAAV